MVIYGYVVSPKDLQYKSSNGAGVVGSDICFVSGCADSKLVVC